MEELTVSIREFYKNKTVFITGGSGFIGKVLIEKLLRSCPDLKRIYILMRNRKNKNAQQRIEEITSQPLFDVLRDTKNAQQAFEKIHLIEGDATLLKLGISEENRKILAIETDIVIHAAASVRFTDNLSKSVIMNVRGTRELVELALEMEKTPILIHVSTAYCQSDQKVIGEQLYPPHADWRKTIELAETVDKRILNSLTDKYIGLHPNTYAFAKSLAEHVVYDLANGKLNVAITRPSIVTSSIKDPFPGWIDNFNGPSAVVVAVSKGVLRTMYCDPDILLDCVPVDVVVKILVTLPWKLGRNQINGNLKEVTFFNVCKNKERPISLRDCIHIGRKIRGEVALNNILWLIFYHLLPAIIIDGILKLAGRKPVLMGIQRRIYVGNMALTYFLHHEWTFLNENAANLLPNDCGDFGYSKDDVGTYEYLLNAVKGGRKYLMKEDESTLERARRNSNKMKILARVVGFLRYFALFWIFFVKFDLISVILKRISQIFFEEQ